MEVGSEKQTTSPNETVIKMLTPSSVAINGSRGFKIQKAKGSTANETSPLQNIIHRASIASSTAKPMYIHMRNPDMVYVSTQNGICI